MIISSDSSYQSSITFEAGRAQQLTVSNKNLKVVISDIQTAQSTLYIEKDLGDKKFAAIYQKRNGKYRLAKFLSKNLETHFSKEIAGGGEGLLIPPAEQCKTDSVKKSQQMIEPIVLSTSISDSCSKVAFNANRVIHNSLDLMLRDQSFAERINDLEIDLKTEQKGKNSECLDLVTGIKNRFMALREQDLKGSLPEIECKMDSKIDPKTCIQGRIDPANLIGQARERITLNFSPECKQINIESQIQGKIIHEYLHRVIPGQELTTRSSMDFDIDRSQIRTQQTEAVIGRVTDYLLNPQIQNKNFCGGVTLNERKETIRPNAGRQEGAAQVSLAAPPAQLASLSATQTGGIERSIASADQDVKLARAGNFRISSSLPGVMIVSPSAASRAAAGSLLSTASVVVGSWMAYAREQKMDPTKTHYYQNPEFANETDADDLSLKLDGANGGARTPASQKGESPTSSNAGSDSGSGTRSNSGAGSGASAPRATRFMASQNLTPAERAQAKVEEIAKTTPLEEGEKSQLQRSLAYVMQAKSPAEMRIFLIQQSAALRQLKVHVADPRSEARKFYGYDDSKTAKIVLSITNQGTLIDETVGAD